ncbi:MAG: response regulator, partial [Rhodobacteraceae bacterium]|nr:response regulator [Paracoccaceae bacterium]
STAYGIVKQTGGYIFCDSILGQGTTFALFFPAHAPIFDEEAAAETVPAPAPRQPLQGQGVVLLVEDEAPVRAFASRALTMRGYTVIEADCAEEALRLLEDTALVVDVFVTDVIMPGMDGPSWVREALKTRPGTRVVFVSGYSEESLTEERDRIAQSVFLPKPFSLSELTATVQAQLQ